MRDRKPQASEPSAWVARFIAGIPAGGRVLDVACGDGRHLALGLRLGLDMTGIDRELTAAAALLPSPSLHLVKGDLEDGSPFPFRGRTFAGVVVAKYLWRPILADIVGAVADDGLLIYETFGLGNERHGRPANAAFLLRPGELLDAVRGRLVPVAYEHVLTRDPVRIVQRICAAGPHHPWASGGAPAG